MNTMTAKEAIYWTPDGKRKQGRLKEKAKNSGKKDERGWSWNYLEIQSRNRTRWRSMVEALCTKRRGEGNLLTK